MARRFKVLRAGTPVLDIVDQPGPLTSISAPPPPPGSEPPFHDFLTGVALSAMDEHELRQVLLRSTSTDDYVANLTAAGFTVEPLP